MKEKVIENESIKTYCPVYNLFNLNYIIHASFGSTYCSCGIGLDFDPERTVELLLPFRTMLL